MKILPLLSQTALLTRFSISVICLVTYLILLASTPNILLLIVAGYYIFKIGRYLANTAVDHLDYELLLEPLNFVALKLITAASIGMFAFLIAMSILGQVSLFYYVGARLVNVVVGLIAIANATTNSRYLYILLARRSERRT